MSLALDSLVSMAEATGNSSYVHQALDVVQNMIGTATLSIELPDNNFHDDDDDPA